MAARAAYSSRIVPSLLQRIARRFAPRNVGIEVTRRCNQACAFCHNVWKAAPGASEELDTAGFLDALDRVLAGDRPDVVTFTGGETLLRDDLEELVRFASRRAKCNVVTNGTLLDAFSREDE